MLWNASAINGYAIVASDGRLGTVSDFLFDDASWSVRWLVVDTGNWLSGRKVLLPPFVLGHPDPKAREFPVIKLTRQQVKDSPDIDTERSVSRQMESSIYGHYGWSPYWGSGVGMAGFGMAGFGRGSFSSGYARSAMAAAPSSSGSGQSEEDMIDTNRSDDDPHLRSIEAVTGYHIHATDGAIGHVEDFLVEDADWSIHYLIVDTKNWWPGKKVLISIRSAHEIDWAQRLVNLGVDRQKVRDSPPYDAAITVDGAYDAAFLTYYGIRWVAPAEKRQ